MTPKDKPLGPAHTPYAVFNSDGELMGRTVYAEDAAVLVATTESGTIRVGTLAVWREGQEDERAAESYDHVAAIVAARVDNAQRATQLRREARTLTAHARGTCTRGK